MLAFIAVSVSAAAPASASTIDDDLPTTWQVQPTGPEGLGDRAYFVLDGYPGATLHDMVAITNLSEREITMKVFGSDAFNAESGEFDLLPSSKEPEGVGSWITIDPQTVASDGSVTIPARSRLNLPVQIEIPANATPGDHVGGVVTSIPTVRTTETGEQVLVDARVAARVYLTVQGDLVPRLQVGAVEAHRTGSWWNPFDGAVEVTWTITNTGNLRLAGRQEVFLEGPFGIGQVAAEVSDLEEVLPGSSVQQAVTIPGVAALGLLTVGGQVQPIDMTGRLSVGVDAVPFTATLIAVPWVVLGAIVVLALGGWFLVRLILRRRAASRELHAELASLKAAAAVADSVVAVQEPESAGRSTGSP